MFNKILHTFFSKSFVGICNFILVMLTTNFLGAEGRGTISLILSSIAIIIVFCNIVGGSVLVYMTPRFPVSSLLIPSSAWAFLTSLAGTLVLYFWNLIEAKYLLHIFILTFLNALMTNNLMVIIAKEKIKTANFLGILQALTTLIVVGISFLVIKYVEIETYVVSLYAAYSIVFIASVFLIKKYFLPFTIDGIFSIFKKMLNYGMLIQLAAVFTLLIYRLSYYMIESYSGRAELGIFSVGVSISEAVWLISGSIALNLFSKVANTEDKKVSRELTIILSRFSFAITFFVLLILAFMPVKLFEKAFGHEFGNVHLVILSLSPGILFFSMNAILNHYFSGTAQYKVITLSTLSGFLLVLILNFILIPKYGMVGAGLASSLAYMTITVYQIIVFKKESGYGLNEFIFSFNDVKLIKEKIKSVSAKKVSGTK